MYINHKCSRYVHLINPEKAVCLNIIECMYGCSVILECDSTLTYLESGEWFSSKDIRSQ